MRQPRGTGVSAFTARTQVGLPRRHAGGADGGYGPGGDSVRADVPPRRPHGARRRRRQRHRRRRRRGPGGVRRRGGLRRRPARRRHGDRRRDRLARRRRSGSTCSTPRRSMPRSRDLGPPDVLVTTPSVNVRKRIVDYTDDELDRVVDLNIKGTFRLCRAFGRGDGRRRARLDDRVLVDPVADDRAGPGRLRGDEGGDGDAVQDARRRARARSACGPTAIAPGVVETPLTAPIKAQPAWYDAYADKTILRRWAQPIGDGRRRGLPCVGCQQLRHRHDDLRRRWLDRRRRPLRAADMTAT